MEPHTSAKARRSGSSLPPGTRPGRTERRSGGDPASHRGADPGGDPASHRGGRSSGPQVDVAILYPSPAGIDGLHAARMVLTEMLNDRMWDIRGKLGATYGTYARHETRVGPSAYRLGGAVDAPRAGEAIKAMRDGLDALRRGEGQGVAFVRARRKVVQQLLGESTVSSELAARLGLIARFSLDPGFYNTLLRQVAVLSIAQVQDLLARELAPNGEVLVVLGDRPSVTKAFADAGITDAKLVEPQYDP